MFIAALWLLQIVFIDDIYAAVKRNELKKAASEAEKYVYDLDGMEDAAKSSSQRTNICYLVMTVGPDETYSTVFSVESSHQCAIHSLDKAGIANLYRTYDGERSITSFRFSPVVDAFLPSDFWIGNEDGPESVVLTEVIRQGDYDILILLDSFVTPLASTVSIINAILITISATMLLTAVLLAAVLSGTIVKPISKINESAKELAKENYDVKFSGKGYREISELSDTLNYTASELSKVDSLKKELIANTSHDLRTPLTMIGGYAEMMRDIPGENTPENADIILRETERLTSLVNDMLDISKLESGTAGVSEEIFSVTSVVSETVARYKSFKSSEGYVISFFAETDVAVKTDRSKYLQAFCNLMNNALTYTGKDRRIDVIQDVITVQSIPHVRITVIDTGDGIPEEQLPLIWDRYYKIPAEHRRAAQGSGLGLSIVKKIMDLLGGSYGVESKPGEGSAFFISIPVYTGE